MSGTPATQFLADKGVEYTEHEFDYLEHGGTGHSSKMLGVPEHAVVKTLIMENEKGDGPLEAVARSWERLTRRSARCKPEHENFSRRFYVKCQTIGDSPLCGSDPKRRL